MPMQLPGDRMGISWQVIMNHQITRDGDCNAKHPDGKVPRMQSGRFAFAPNTHVQIEW